MTKLSPDCRPERHPHRPPPQPAGHQGVVATVVLLLLFAKFKGLMVRGRVWLIAGGCLRISQVAQAEEALIEPPRTGCAANAATSSAQCSSAAWKSPCASSAWLRGSGAGRASALKRRWRAACSLSGARGNRRASSHSHTLWSVDARAGSGLLHAACVLGCMHAGWSVETLLCCSAHAHAPWTSIHASMRAHACMHACSLDQTHR
jgi:hypothetical protein